MLGKKWWTPRPFASVATCPIAGPQSAQELGDLLVTTNFPLHSPCSSHQHRRIMSVMLETSLGDLVIDLEVDRCPRTCENFLKLCKIKYYALNAFFNGG